MDIEITPLPKTIPPAEMDELLNGELSEFERWFIEKQRRAGADGIGLIGPERGILKTYLLYAATKRRGGEEYAWPR